ncbi:MAG TPA: 50S ribosomal protein L31e [Candidatus Bilamarchaeaceae archaeon]|nr:50S ribosomal protein L31e [Candidatus Bilamarchaeaceae archaeon]
MAELERIYTIPLGKAYDLSRVRRAGSAVKIVRSFLARHMKAEKGAVRVSAGINELLWARGIQKPPRKIKVRAVKDAGRVLATLVDEKPEEKKEVKKAGGKEGPKKGEAAAKAEAPKKEGKAAPGKEERKG